MGILGVVKVVIHDRTEELPPQLRDYCERKLARVTRHFDKVMRAEVEFDQERKRSAEPARVVRILLHMENGAMIATSRAGARLLRERFI